MNNDEAVQYLLEAMPGNLSDVVTAILVQSKPVATATYESAKCVLVEFYATKKTKSSAPHLLMTLRSKQVGWTNSLVETTEWRRYVALIEMNMATSLLNTKSRRSHKSQAPIMPLMLRGLSLERPLWEVPIGMGTKLSSSWTLTPPNVWCQMSHCSKTCSASSYLNCEEWWIT